MMESDIAQLLELWLVFLLSETHGVNSTLLFLELQVGIWHRVRLISAIATGCKLTMQKKATLKEEFLYVKPATAGGDDVTFAEWEMNRCPKFLFLGIKREKKRAAGEKCSQRQPPPPTPPPQTDDMPSPLYVNNRPDLMCFISISLCLWWTNM